MKEIRRVKFEFVEDRMRNVEITMEYLSKEISIDQNKQEIVKDLSMSNKSTNWIDSQQYQQLTSKSRDEVRAHTYENVLKSMTRRFWCVHRWVTIDLNVFENIFEMNKENVREIIETILSFEYEWEVLINMNLDLMLNLTIDEDTLRDIVQSVENH